MVSLRVAFQESCTNRPHCCLPIRASLGAVWPARFTPPSRKLANGKPVVALVERLAGRPLAPLPVAVQASVPAELPAKHRVTPVGGAVIWPWNQTSLPALNECVPWTQVRFALKDGRSVWVSV